MTAASGPTSAAGKETVSGNALVHGLSSSKPKHAALPGEEDAFAEFSRAIVADLAPVGATESALARDIAIDRWRLFRAKKMEDGLFDHLEMEYPRARTRGAAHALAFVDASKGLQKIALYANRIQRALEKNTAALEARQAERKAAYEKAQQEAMLLTELAQAKGETYKPAPDFPSAGRPGQFVYSADEIHRLIARTRRLEEAAARLASSGAGIPARARAESAN